MIHHTLHELLQYLKQEHFGYELILVTDGCSDDTVLEASEISDPHLRIVSYEENRGKGYAIRHGLEFARGELVMFYDAGGEFAPEHVTRFMRLFKIKPVDMVVGSKRHPDSVVYYPWVRRVLSLGYRALATVLFQTRIRDTQTGLKMMTRATARRLFHYSTVRGYAFDLELLVIARRLGFENIIEAPITLEFNALTSSITPKAVWRMFLDTILIFYRKNMLHAYDRIHQEAAP